MTLLNLSGGRGQKGGAADPPEAGRPTSMRANHFRLRANQFRDLLVWQKAMALARQVYAVTGKFPKDEGMGLSSLMRRAAIAIPSNVAEGEGQLTDKAFALFLSRARGALYELETQAELAGGFGFLTREELDQLVWDCHEVGRILQGLLNSMKDANT